MGWRNQQGRELAHQQQKCLQTWGEINREKAVLREGANLDAKLDGPKGRENGSQVQEVFVKFTREQECP